MTIGRPPNPPPVRPAPASWAGPGWWHGLANLGAGMDAMAERAGHPDGFHLVAKELGVAPGEISAASEAQAWEWFLAAYDRWGDRGSGIGDVVAVGHGGIADPNGSGWGELFR